MDNSFAQSAQDYFKKSLLKYNPQDVIDCKAIIEEAVDEILHHYEFIDFVNSKKDKDQSNTGIWTKLFQRKQNQQEKNAETMIQILKKFEIREVKHCGQSIQHIRVHKQVVPNLCGYHASFNIIQMLQSIKYNTRFQLHQSASFWSYVVRTQSFLKKYAIQTKKDRESWPWTDDDLQNGDFERTYWKVCMEKKPTFINSFKTETVDGITYHIRNVTIFFQYRNLINTNDERMLIEQTIEQFKQFQADEKNQMTLACMLGITNHWISCIAQKTVNGLNFFVLDSRNRDYLEWTEHEMVQYLDEEIQNRIIKGQTAWTKFHVDMNLQCMKDIQQCVQLLSEWVSGNSTIEQFVSNSRVMVFLYPLAHRISGEIDSFLNFHPEGEKISQTYQIVNGWAEEYYHTIKSFLNQSAKGMTLESKELVRKSLEISQACYAYQYQENLWQNPKKKSKLQVVVNSLEVVKNRL